MSEDLPKTDLKLGTGRLSRGRVHNCKLPGTWTILWHRIQNGDLWTCGFCDRQWAYWRNGIFEGWRARD